MEPTGYIDIDEGDLARHSTRPASGNRARRPSARRLDRVLDTGPVSRARTLLQARPEPARACADYGLARRDVEQQKARRDRNDPDENIPIRRIYCVDEERRRIALLRTGTLTIRFGRSTAQSVFFRFHYERLAHPRQTEILDLPGEGSASELHVFAQTQSPTKARPAGLALPQSMAWLAGPGIYHGRLSFPSSNDAVHPGDGIIESASLVPFPSGPIKPTHVSSTVSSPAKQQQQQTTETPKSMALTEWHFVVLYEEKIKAVSLLSDKVVFESDLNLVGSLD